MNPSKCQQITFNSNKQIASKKGIILMVSTWKWGPGFHPGMPKSALAGLMEAGSDVVATRSATIALCSETESGFGDEVEVFI